jgi:acyl-CoA synthetase (AMP-forming)/AMP-acid ligase II
LNWIRTAEAVYSSREAVVDGDRRLTFKDVARRSDRAANVLRALTGTGSSNIALLVGNRAEAIELDIACIKAGLGRVSLNPRLADDERKYILGDSSARVLVYGSDYAEFAASLTGQDITLVEVGDDPAGPGRSYEDALKESSESHSVTSPDPHDPSLIMYTSGTTGRPKGAVWSFATRHAAVDNMLRNELGASESRRMVHVGPLAHGSGSKVVPVYVRGGCNITMDRFDPDQFLELVRSEHATASFMVPTMVQMLVDAVGETTTTTSLRHVAYGGAKMPLGTIQQALDCFGPVFFQIYGSCEAPHPVLVLACQDHIARNLDVLSSAGRPGIGVEVRVGFPDTEFENGATGEVMVRSPHVFAGYWNDAAATSEVMSDGWFRTGDVGRIDDDGLVSIVGRVKEMIISGGFNVYPAEVERILLTHPRVASACVYGVPDARWGEQVAAAIVPSGDIPPTFDELMALCSKELAGYKKPRVYRVLTELPLGPTGKVLREAVRDSHDRTGS